MVRQFIDPELRSAVEQRPSFDIWADIATTRMLYQQGMLAKAQHVPLLEHVPFTDHLIPSCDDDAQVRVRVYQPEDLDSPRPAMLWIHGGGYVLGSIDIEVPMMQRLASAAGCTIVAVEYRLAPEHPFPTPLNDCYAALSWMFQQASQLQIDPQRIAIAGISAGGGLAAALALMARERGEFKPLFQLLLCPMLDDRNQQPSTHFELQGISWSREDNRSGWEAYLGGQFSESLPSYAVPARAPDLSALPPTYIAVGGLDLFLDEDLAYARRLMEAQVSTELHVFPGAFHGFEFIAPEARVSKRAHHLMSDILRHAFNQVQCN